MVNLFDALKKSLAADNDQEARRRLKTKHSSQPKAKPASKAKAEPKAKALG